MTSGNEERLMLLEKLQWARMRMNEASAQWQIRYHELQIILQATIDHIEGNDHGIHRD